MAQYWALGTPWYFFLFQILLLCWAFIPVSLDTGRYVFGGFVLLYGIIVLALIVWKQMQLINRDNMEVLNVQTPLTTLLTQQEDVNLIEYRTISFKKHIFTSTLILIGCIGGMAGMFMLFSGPIPGVLLLYVSRLLIMLPNRLTLKEQVLAVLWAVISDGSFLIMGMRHWVDVDLRGLRWFTLLLLPLLYSVRASDTPILGVVSALAAFMDLYSIEVKMITAAVITGIILLLWLLDVVSSSVCIGVVVAAAMCTDKSPSYLGEPLQSAFIVLMVLPTICEFTVREFTIPLEAVALALFVVGVAQIIWNPFHAGAVMFAVIGTIEMSHRVHAPIRLNTDRTAQINSLRETHPFLSAGDANELIERQQAFRAQREWFPVIVRLQYISRAWFFVQTILASILFELMWLKWLSHDLKLVRLHQFIQLWTVAWIGLCVRESVVAWKMTRTFH